MKKLLASFGWAMHGLHTVWREEFNFRIEVILSLTLLLLAWALNFSRIEWIIVVALVMTVLGTEVVNTVIEDLCNKVEPHHDPIIGKIKDMAAGFVFISAVGAGIIGVLLLLPHLF